MKKIQIDKKELYRLYVEENKSSYEIAQIFNCNRQSISNKIKEYKIPLKSRSFARTKYLKYPFNGDLEEKSYLIGLRLGDLNVYKPHQLSEIIVARCHTTQNEQSELIKQLFSKYGRVSCSNGKYGSNLNCYLDTSFDFLLPKTSDVPTWIKNKSEICCFIAGYTDAEGCFLLNQGRARLKLESYDQTILKWISENLQVMNIENKLKQIGWKGQIRSTKYKFPINKDLWRLDINKASSVLKFATIIGPFLKHRIRVEDMIMCRNNVLKRFEKKPIKHESI